jgi:hypothetical protein
LHVASTLVSTNCKDKQLLIYIYEIFLSYVKFKDFDLVWHGQLFLSPHPTFTVTQVKIISIVLANSIVKNPGLVISKQWPNLE